MSTFAKQFESYLLGRGRAPTTIRAYIRDLDFIARKCDKDPDKIQLEDLDVVFGRRGLSPARQHRLRQSWKSFTVFASKRLSINLPVAEYDAPVRWKPKPSLEPEQRLAVFRSCVTLGDIGIGPMLVLHTGMRSEEARTRRVGDVMGNLLTILGKESKTREVPLSKRPPCPGVPSAIELVNTLTTEKTGDRYLLGNGINPWSATKLYEATAKVGRVANVPGLHPHQLRRGWATDLRRRGVDLDVIRALLGHGSLDVTMRYLGVGQHDLRQVQAVLDRED